MTDLKENKEAENIEKEGKKKPSELFLDFLDEISEERRGIITYPYRKLKRFYPTLRGLFPLFKLSNDDYTHYCNRGMLVISTWNNIDKRTRIQDFVYFINIFNMYCQEGCLENVKEFIDMEFEYISLDSLQHHKVNCPSKEIREYLKEVIKRKKALEPKSNCCVS